MFDLNTGQTTNHKRQLDLKRGILKRSFTWENAEGHRIDVTIERFVSYDYRELLAQKITVTPHEDGCELQIAATLDDLRDMGGLSEEVSNDPRIKAQKERRFDSEKIEQADKQLLHIETNSSNLHLIVGAMNTFSDESAEVTFSDGTESWKTETKKGEAVTLERFVAYSNIFNEGSEKDEKTQGLSDLLDDVSRIGFEELKEKHTEFMKDFWDKSDIQIDGDDELQVGLRFNLFHLHQAAGRDGKRNMSAKALSGEGYEGHYFWDTEMYMLPFFLYTQPEIAKQLLNCRYTILPQARERAREMAVETGALFAWRTINGKEASPYYPAGTAQIHINGDIAHAVHAYIDATGDQAFAMNEGLEILIETARFYYEWGHIDEQRGGAFVLNDVTGPDEYTAIVNNNYYTNLMAKHNFKYAAEMVELALRSESEDGRRVLDKIGFEESERANWKRAHDTMFLPYDEDQKLTMQDDSFFHKEVWDIENTPKENFPLLLHYHPLTIYRYQVNKQADTVLAEFLFSDEFDQDQKARDYDYYEAVTTHDSSLSRSVFGMMASHLGDMEKAYNYFMDTALMDITDMQSNTKDGVHAANMGGTWMSMVYGFAGMHVIDKVLNFSPKLPKDWNTVTFKIQFQNRLIEVSIGQTDTDYTLLKGEPLKISHNGEEKHLE